VCMAWILARESVVPSTAHRQTDRQGRTLLILRRSVGSAILSGCAVFAAPALCAIDIQTPLSGSINVCINQRRCLPTTTNSGT